MNRPDQDSAGQGFQLVGCEGSAEQGGTAVDCRVVIDALDAEWASVGGEAVLR